MGTFTQDGEKELLVLNQTNKMKNSLYILTLLLLFSTSLKSQINSSLFFLGGISTFEEKTPDRDFLYYPNPALGIGYEISFPIKNQFSINTGLNFQLKAGKSRYVEYNNDVSFDISSTLRLYSFSVPVKLQYEIPLKKSSLYIGTGGFVGVNLIGTNNSHIITTFSNWEGYSNTSSHIKWREINTSSNSYDLKRFDLGIVFSCDYKINRFLIGLNSEIGMRNLSSYPRKELKFTTKSLMLKIGFSLNNKKENI